jgi:Exportin 1-like protein
VSYRLLTQVFDFSRGELTQAKIKDLKNSLNHDFRLIHELCLFVLNASQKVARPSSPTASSLQNTMPQGGLLRLGFRV